MLADWRTHSLAPLPIRLPLATQQRALTWLIFAVLVVFKFRYNAAVVFFGIDGSYYYEVARNIRDGHGITSMVSLYHQGFTSFPHPTPIYPLWPLMLGMVGRLVDLQWAAVWLPTLLFFTALVLLYHLTLKVWSEPLFPQVWPVFHAGHFTALFLGLNERFFRHTSQPYTEGLAFTLLLLGLVRARVWMLKGGWPRAVEVGMWFGLTFLARSQMVVALLALGLTLLWSVVGSRTRFKAGWEGVAVATGVVLVILPHWLNLSTYISNLTIGHLIHFEKFQETPDLRKVVMSVQTSSWWEWLLDRGRGVWIGFRPRGRFSYFHCFYTYYLAIPVAFPLLALDVWSVKKDGRLGEVWQFVIRRENLFVVLLGMLALGGFWSLHTIHKPVFLTWNFGSRHALTGSFLVMISVLYLTRAATLGRVWALLIVCVGLHWSGKVLTEDMSRMEQDQARRATSEPERPNETREGDEDQGITSLNLELRAWIAEHQLQDPQLILAMPDPQPLARYTTGVGYHWVSDVTTLRDLSVMTSRLGVDYVLLPSRSVRYWNTTNPDVFFAHFMNVAQDVSGYDIFRRSDR